MKRLGVRGEIKEDGRRKTKDGRRKTEERMRRLILIIAAIFCYSVNNTSGQENTDSVSSSIEKLFLRLRENHPVEKKIEINDSLCLIIDSYSVSDTVFNHRFSNLKYLGQITSPDSLVKIITWNLILEDGENRYFCYVIRRNKPDAKKEVFRLKGFFDENKVRTDTTYSLTDWYGALYYDLRPFDIDGVRRYLILGIDYGNSFINRKIIDVLNFEGLEGLVFGMRCFSGEGSTGYRILFEYSSTAVMSLKFEEDTLVVFDHLSPFTPELLNNRQFYGPDFSFDSYKFEKDLWKFEGDIDIKNR